MNEAAVRLTALLDRKQCSQRELAQLMGMSRRNVTRIVNGHTRLTAESALRIACALDLDDDELLALMYAAARDALDDVRERWV